MKKEALLIVVMLAGFSLVAAGCSSKYMLSGTWYSDEDEATPTYVFYDNGKVEIGDDRYAYKMTDKDTLRIELDIDAMAAVIDRDTDEITLLDKDGKEIARLYKVQSEAAASFQTKEDALAVEMTDMLSGSWMMEGGEVTMIVDGDKCTMVTTHEGRQVKTVYQAAYPEADKIQFISSGNEVVAEFIFSISSDTLAFTDEDGNTTKYVRKEG
ncbi:hypothetical protein ACDL92_09855 [Ihubacter sp. mB4P-1]|uniref:hypothetical protein n=1 Tax=Ihubacter sp. mB4P-1 TaxID=3242370 RepID=UPI003C7A97ED